MEPEEKILAYLTTHDSMTRSNVDTLLGVSQATASRILKRMVGERIIYKEGNGRGTVYRKNMRKH
jgi:ATP-dependent DNA helicase RecG